MYKKFNDREEKFEGNNEVKADPLHDAIFKKENKRILLILEDEQSIIKIYMKMFKEFDCVFMKTIKEGENLLKKLKENNIEPLVLIADFYLPDGTSTQFIEKVKEAYPNIKVILVSSEPSAKQLAKHDVFFEKMNLFEIASKVEEYFSK
ncbi:MAG: response regulator [Candidatus Micrarchaeota archaeon]|nr:response regulator [Candidatus Micrarchaeota archaeon]